jgi:hypothetical protein
VIDREAQDERDHHDESDGDLVPLLIPYELGDEFDHSDWDRDDSKEWKTAQTTREEKETQNERRGEISEGKEGGKEIRLT